MKIIIDTREQKPLAFNKSKAIEGVIKKKLDVGDYSIEGYEDKIAIERKSPGDLFGSLFGGHKRFQKELEKGMDYDFFMIFQWKYMKILKIFENIMKFLKNMKNLKNLEFFRFFTF